MAGKTFRGFGEDENPSSRESPEAAPDFDEEQDARGDHSSPTVVDDGKVAEVLKKLRALDGARAGTAKVTEVVADANSSEPTRIESAADMDTAPNPAPDFERPSQRTTAKSDEIVRLAQRATSIGRSLSTPVEGQPITIPADGARGTMFGRSIHLPEINAPEDASIELSSGAVQYLDDAPTASQPFPLADRPVEQSGGYAPPDSGAHRAPDSGAHRSTDLVGYRAPEASAYEDRSYGSDPRTDLIGDLRPRRSGRLIAIAGGLAVVGAGWLGWTQLRGSRPADDQAPAAVRTARPAPEGAPAATGPAVAPLPSTAAPSETPTPPTAPSAAGPSPIPPATAPPAATTTASATAAADEPPSPKPAASDDAPAPARRARSARERHSARGRAPAEESSPPDAKPTRSHRPGASPDDPDDTLPPSL